jgi:hypothetical protein
MHPCSQIPKRLAQQASNVVHQRGIPHRRLQCPSAKADREMSHFHELIPPIRSWRTLFALTRTGWDASASREPVSWVLASAISESVNYREVRYFWPYRTGPAASAASESASEVKVCAK